MIDVHENEEQKKHRENLISEYITAIKPRCHRWVQIPVAKFNEFTDRQEILNAGYTYTGMYGTPMIKFHVDDHPCLQERAKNKYGNFVGNISERVTNQKPIIIFGQDKLVLNQFSFDSKQ